MRAQLRQKALELGLQSVAIIAIDEVPSLTQALESWLAEGRHGDMAWMGRNPARRADPKQVLNNVRSIITCTFNYFTPHAQSDDPRRGRISRYAWGDDYHKVLLPKLKTLASFLQQLDPEAESICYVDTGPVMEKHWAARAGLGWQGKHTNLIDPQRGSWLFIGEILTTYTFPPPLGEGQGEGEAHVNSPSPQPSPQGRGGGCGTCTRCIDVCPTRAITAPYQLDARRCISYLTIEHKGSIPLEMRPLLGNHIYGCDLCQEVCPWNRFATPTPEPAFQPRPGILNPELIPLLYMTDEDFRVRFKDSPIKRITRARLLRNVAVALGNSQDPAAIPALRHALSDPEPLVREHAEWALAQLFQRGADTLTL
jgi:epoxyqueuosine reductase